MAYIREAVEAINSQCDGAIQRDGVGFNGVDSGFAKDLLRQTTWSPKQEEAALKMLRKYKRQLENLGITSVELSPKSPKTEDTSLPTLDFKNNTFILKTRMEHRQLARSLPGANWDSYDKQWYYKPTYSFMSALLKVKNQVDRTSEASNKLNSLYKQEQKKQQAQQELSDQVSKALEIKQSKATNIPAPVKSPPYEHQQTAFNLGVLLHHCGFFMEQGTGKTLPAIGLIGFRAKQGCNKTIIFCSKSVATAWKKQLKAHADFDYRITVLTDKEYGSTKQKVERFNWISKNPTNTADVVVINYESTWRIEDTIISWKPDFAICDESHHIKNGRSNQSKSIIKIGKNCSYRLALTGTPITQSPANIFSQMQFIDDSVFGRSYVKFRDRYSVMGGYMGKEIVGWKVFESINNQEGNKSNPYYEEYLTKEFAEKMHGLTYRVTKKELKEKGILILPEEFSEIRYATLEPKVQKMVESLQNDYIATLSSGDKVVAPLAITAILRINQITGGFIRPTHHEGKEELLPMEQISTAKLDVLKEAVEELIESNHKFLVFCLFTEEVNAISNMLDNLKIKHEVLQGKTKKSREEIIDSFEQDEQVRAMVIQIKTGREGITLTQADTVIFYNFDSSVEAHEQAKARAHRIGQESDVTYIYIVAENTWNEKVLFAIKNNLQIAAMATEDLRQLFETNKEEELMARLPKEIQQQIDNIPGDNPEYQDTLESILADIERDLEEVQPKARPWVEPEKPKKKKKSSKSATINLNFKDEATKEYSKSNIKSTESKSTSKVKTEKQSSLNSSGETITLKDLAEELGIEAKVIRKWCRKNLGERTSGRWEWESDSHDLDTIRKAHS